MKTPKIVRCLTTKEDITFTKDEEGNVKFDVDSHKFHLLLCKREGRTLYKSNPKHAFMLGYLTRLYVEKVKKEYPELYKTK